MTTLKEKIVVMMAFEAGRTIECQHRDDTLKEWHPAGVPTWNWPLFEYRVAKTKFVARVPLSTCYTYMKHPPTPNTPVAVVSWEE